jgi:hypothetical protein
MSLKKGPKLTENTSRGDDLDLISEQRQSSDWDESGRQLADDDEDGDTDVESAQVAELDLTDALQPLEEKRLPASDFDQSHTVQDFLDGLDALVSIPHERGGRDPEEDWDDEDQREEGGSEDADASPDRDTEDPGEEVDDHGDLDGNGPCKVAEFNGFRDLSKYLAVDALKTDKKRTASASTLTRLRM